MRRERDWDMYRDIGSEKDLQGKGYDILQLLTFFGHCSLYVEAMWKSQS